jgi:ribosomal-protein-serine acetyltransferase
MTQIPVSEDISLSIISPFDAEELFSLVDENREYLRKYLPWVDDTKTIDDSRSFINLALKRFSESIEMTYFIRKTNKIIGTISIWLENKNTGIYEIGYWIAENYSKQGIMTKCISEIIKTAFNVFGALKIQISCIPQNEGSNRISQKVNMKLEGTIRNAEKLNGQISDHNIYGILKEEYKKNPLTTASSG